MDTKVKYPNVELMNRKLQNRYADIFIEIQGEFVYRVKNYKYQDHEVEELNQKKMIVLIPFQLLKLKKIIKKKRTQENLNALSKLLNNDII